MSTHVVRIDTQNQSHNNSQISPNVPSVVIGMWNTLVYMIRITWSMQKIAYKCCKITGITGLYQQRK